MPNRLEHDRLELDGGAAQRLSSAEGGFATADVIVEKLGSDHIQHKHLGAIKYEPITVTSGVVTSKDLYDWLEGTLSQAYALKNGSIIAVDADGKDLSRLEFHQALISEISFPALDAASKERSEGAHV